MQSVEERIKLWEGGAVTLGNPDFVGTTFNMGESSKQMWIRQKRQRQDFLLIKIKVLLLSLNMGP